MLHHRNDAKFRTDYLESEADERATLHTGMRLTFRRVVEAVALYPRREDLFRNYPELEPEDVEQALAFAAANLEDHAADPDACLNLSNHCHARCRFPYGIGGVWRE